MISDLEMVFLDISNLDEIKATEEVEILGQAIASKGLRTKINITKLNGETLKSKKQKSAKIGI